MIDITMGGSAFFIIEQLSAYYELQLILAQKRFYNRETITALNYEIHQIHMYTYSPPSLLCK